MEITRQIKSIVAAATDTAVPTRASQVQARPPVARSASSEPLALGQLQADLAALPEVDMAKVDAIKQALQRGDISLDSAALSRSILAYHTGSDV